MSFGGAQGMYEKMMAAKREKEAAAAAAAAGSSAPAAGAGSAAAADKPPDGLKLTLPAIVPPKNGKLVIFGATNYADMGKKIGKDLDKRHTQSPRAAPSARGAR